MRVTGSSATPASRHQVVLGYRAWAGYDCVRLPCVLPETTHEVVWTPQRPLLVSGIAVALRLDLPEVDYFRAARRAGGSRRRGQLASQQWAATRLGMLRDPWRFLPRLDVGVEVGDRVVLPPSSLASMWVPSGQPLLEYDLVAPVLCQAGQDVRARVSSRDCRRADVSLTLRGREVRRVD